MVLSRTGERNAFFAESVLIRKTDDTLLLLIQPQIFFERENFFRACQGFAARAAGLCSEDEESSGATRKSASNSAKSTVAA